MIKYIVLSFGFLALGFYELSGGDDFDPQAARLAAIESRQERDAERLADLSATPVTNARPAVEIASEGREATFVTQDTVTRADLNLVSFEAAVQHTNRPDPKKSNTAVPTPKTTVIDTTPLAELAEQVAKENTPLTIAALERPENPVAFTGTRTVAASSAIVDVQDIRAIKGTLVNMRSGPGTNYDVVDQLAQNTKVEVLSDSGNGWVELRPVDGGVTGWVAAFLLTNG